MRANEIVENNRRIGNSSLKTNTEIERATLSVLTDISETLAVMTDLIASIYGREILNREQMEQIRRQQGMRDVEQ